jgi:hypothetical protein
MGFKNIKGEFNRAGLIADFISGKYVGNSAKKVFGRIVDFSATGGTITTAAGKTIHTFTSSGTFVVTLGSADVEYLVVAGGGGGGSSFAGGGGAGGYRSSVIGESSGGGSSAESLLSVSPGPYSITVGAGGAIDTNGANSVFSTITSTGGGGGGSGTINGIIGGSGGGGGYVASGAAGTTNQGRAGGNGSPTFSSNRAAGGGGGGSNIAGQNAPNLDNGGPGGDGNASSITVTSTT